MNTSQTSQTSIAVIGLGYVGLPLAIALSHQFKVIGYDLNQSRIDALHQGIDGTGELSEAEVVDARVTFTSDVRNLDECNFFIVAVPTPVDEGNRPDLTALKQASVAVGKAMSAGAVVVYESTVYPGVTEDICGPILAEHSGLVQGVDFHLGYSPERVSPGDKARTLTQIVKIVSGDDADTARRVKSVYESVVTAGVYLAPSIRVAEAAKVLENVQRDVNIALMNEAALIFDRLGIRTSEVLAAAGSKWNFLPFSPGLVGGHCIGVDPWYLVSKSMQVGYDPALIIASRRLNDSMGYHIASRCYQALKVSPQSAKVAILGLTFKEDVRDLRNSRVIDIISGLESQGVSPLVHDEVCDRVEAKRFYNLDLVEWEDISDGELDAIILAVPHAAYRNCPNTLLKKLKKNGILMDVKSAVPESLVVPEGMRYWSL